MRKQFLIFVVLAVSFSANAEAASRKGATAETYQGVNGGQSLPLTAVECRRLGGNDIGGRTECATGIMCVVNKPNGEVFQQCINEVK